MKKIINFYDSSKVCYKTYTFSKLEKWDKLSAGLLRKVYILFTDSGKLEFVINNRDVKSVDDFIEDIELEDEIINIPDLEPDYFTLDIYMR